VWLILKLQFGGKLKFRGFFIISNWACFINDRLFIRISIWFNLMFWINSIVFLIDHINLLKQVDLSDPGEIHVGLTRQLGSGVLKVFFIKHRVISLNFYIDLDINILNENLYAFYIVHDCSHCYFYNYVKNLYTLRG